MEKSPKRLDRPSFWKWAIPLVLGLEALAILGLGMSGTARLVGGIKTFVIVVSAMAVVRLVLIVLLAMVLARRFRDIGWPAWIGPIVLLVTTLGPVFLVTYAVQTYNSDILEWRTMVGWISDSVNLVLLIVAGSMPGKTARARNIEIARVFE